MPQSNAQGGGRRPSGTNAGGSGNKVPSGGQNYRRQGTVHNKQPGKKVAEPQIQPRAETKASHTTNKAHPITKLIPQSLYNPETGKVLGFLSAEDLLIVALILLLIDSGDDEADNTMLIYALIYILIAEHMELPFL